MEKRKSAERTMPIVHPAQPVVVRMNGACEEFDINLTSLKKRNGWSDVVVTRGFDDSFTVNSRTCRPGKDARHHRTNNCALTSEQTEVIRYILSINFQKEK